MFAIVVNEKGGEQKRLEFDKPEVTIGRVQGNDIILPKGNVSKRHSRIVLKDGKFIIVDLKSTNGTYVNGRKITSPLVVKSSDKIYIGDFILSIEELGAGAGVGDEPQVPPPPPRKTTASIPPPPPRRAPAPLEDEEGADGGPGSLGGEPEEEPMRSPRPTAPSPMSPPSMAPAPLPAAPAPRPTLSATAPPPSRAPIEPRPAPMAAPRPAPAPAPLPRPAPAPAPSPVARPARPAVAPAPAMRPVPGSGPSGKAIEILQRAAARLQQQLNLDGRDYNDDSALWGRAERAAQELIDQHASELPSGVDPDLLAKDLAAEVLGLGPLEDLMADEGVREISVARYDRIFVDRGGALQATQRFFSSPDAAARAIERLLARAGRLAQNGLVEARLESGWIASGALAPISARGASLTLRRPRRAGARLADLVSQGWLSQGMADILELAVRGRRNIVVSGPAGSGRSTVLAALARITDAERIVSVEEAEELDLGEGPWIALTGRGPTARTAIGHALRLRPERLVVGDVRGPEAFDLVSAMASGVEGVSCAVLAATAAEAPERIKALAGLAAEAPSERTLADAIARAIHVVVQLGRGGDESRVLEIYDVTAGEAVFSFKPDGAGGRFAASGHVPTWAESAPPSVFRA